MTGTLDRVKTALSRKLGPFPAWAWLAGLTGFMLVYRRYAAGAATAAQTTPATALPALTDTGYQPSQPAASDGGGGDSGLGLTQPQDQTGDFNPFGVGAPIVYDPASDTYGTGTDPGAYTGTPAVAPATATAAPPPDTSSSTKSPGAAKPAAKAAKAAKGTDASARSVAKATAQVAAAAKKIIGKDVRDELHFIDSLFGRPPKTTGKKKPRNKKTTGKPKATIARVQVAPTRPAPRPRAAAKPVTRARSASKVSVAPRPLPNPYKPNQAGFPNTQVFHPGAPVRQPQSATSAPAPVREVTTAPTVATLRPRTQQLAVEGAKTSRVLTHGQVIE